MEEEVRVTATSFESFEDAVNEALKQLPEGSEGLKSAVVQEQTVMEGGFVGPTQYGVTLVATPPDRERSRPA